MDVIGLQKALEKFNEESVPLLVAAIEKLIDHVDFKFDQNVKDLDNVLNGVLDRLTIQPRKQ